MKFLALAVVFALLGVAASCGIAWWAAHRWTSFSDFWLFTACILPVFGTLGGAWKGTPKEAWPPGFPKRLLVAALCGAFAGIGSYVAFALVSVTWNGGVHGDFLSKLLDPSSIPQISTTKRGFTNSTGVIGHAAICAGVGGIMPFFWLRKKAG
jgi:hypothetical protein